MKSIAGFKMEVGSGFMDRIIIDTNIFVGSAWNPSSASRRIVDACRAGRCRLVVSEPIRREYERMLPRAIRDRNQLRQTLALIDQAEVVEPGLTPRVVREDPEDDKFFAAAWAGGVGVIVSNDRGLLEIDGAEGVRVMRPGEFVGGQSSGSGVSAKADTSAKS